jgi:hypothetical protein
MRKFKLISHHFALYIWILAVGLLLADFGGYHRWHSILPTPWLPYTYLGHLGQLPTQRRIAPPPRSGRLFHARGRRKGQPAAAVLRLVGRQRPDQIPLPGDIRA